MFLIADTDLVDFRLLFSVAIPAVLAVVLNYWGHHLNLQKESVNRRAERRLKGLEIAYQRLARIEFVKELDGDDDTKGEFQKFVADIQLWGTPKQHKMTLEMINLLVSQKSANTIPLLIELRDSLRRDLKLEPLPDEYLWLKFEAPSPPPKIPNSPDPPK